MCSNQEEMKQKIYELLVKDIHVIISKPEKFESYVIKLLEDAANILDIHRVCLYELNEDSTYTKTFEFDQVDYDNEDLRKDSLQYEGMHNELKTHFEKYAFLELNYRDKVWPQIVDYIDKYNIRASLLIPIYVNEIYWGFLVFNDCTQIRNVTPFELDVFQKLAFNIGAAVHVQRKYMKLVDTNGDLRMACNIANEMIRRNTRNLRNENERIKASMKLQNSIY